MWLVNTITKRLESFVSEQDVEYAILSHRWEKEEVLFEDMPYLEYCTKAGKSKLEACCEVALQKRIYYVWIDTCCIEKKSSAELSEAVNSMYRYYATAQQCFAYLSDVDSTPDEERFRKQFQLSQWFTRCWTLQELLAPGLQTLLFYNAHWKRLGSKADLILPLTNITNIHVGALLNFSPSEYSVAERMSWASRREATRKEDVAYSLMGLFEVNMPMLYGEGDKAFIRLQEEILRYSHDETLFAWSLPLATMPSEREEDLLWHSRTGLLAPSPVAFAECRHMKFTKLFDGPGFALTNRGLSGELMVKDGITLSSERVALTLLNATLNPPGEEERFVGIYLKQASSMDSTNYSKSSDENTNYIRVGLNSSGRHHLEPATSPRGSTRREGTFAEMMELETSQRKVHVRHRGLVKEQVPKFVCGVTIDRTTIFAKNDVQSSSHLYSPSVQSISPSRGAVWVQNSSRIVKVASEQMTDLCNIDLVVEPTSQIIKTIRLYFITDTLWPAAERPLLRCALVYDVFYEDDGDDGPYRSTPNRRNQPRKAKTARAGYKSTLSERYQERRDQLAANRRREARNGRDRSFMRATDSLIRRTSEMETWEVERRIGGNLKSLDQVSWKTIFDEDERDETLTMPDWTISMSYVPSDHKSYQNIWTFEIRGEIADAAEDNDGIS